MEIVLNLNLKQETKKTNGKERPKYELFQEQLFRVERDENKTKVFDYQNKLVKVLDNSETKKIFRTKRTEYPAVYNYETGVLTIVKYIPLHGHSSYSILDCISRPEDIAAKAELAIAVTDHGNMFGALKFYKEMKKVGKKPILGFEAYTSSLDYVYETKDGDTLRKVLKENHVSLEEFLKANNNNIVFETMDGELIKEEEKDILLEKLRKPELIQVKGGQKLNIHKANAKNHLVLLAKSEKGYKNLVKLTTIGYKKFTRGRPQIDWDDLRKYSEDVVALSACLAGELPRAILKGKMDQARKIIREMISIFGKENYYIEIQRHGIDEERILNPILLQLAEEFGLKVVATADNHYTNEEDQAAHEAHLAIGTKSRLTDPNRWTFDGKGYHIHSSTEMEELFHDLPEVLDNTLDLAEKLNAEIPTDQLYMPHFPIPEGFESESAYFEHLVKRGFKDRFKGRPEFTDPKYIETLEFEIETINNMEFPGYFLIVADFVNFAKRNYHLVDEQTANRWKDFIKRKGHDPRPLAVGPGRGSACGSLVAYCLHITDVDPLEYGLLFERFLNPDRVSMPDIDLDFPDTRREEVLEYVRELYGKDSVSGIITFGTLKPKMAVRDVARVMGFEPSLGDKIAKMIPDKLELDGKNLKITLENIVKYDVGFSQLYESDPDVKKVVDLAMRLEGLPRNTSQHACGYVIAAGDVSNYIPQATVFNKDTKERDTVTQYTMSEVEEVGLLKMDFLGLRTMGVFDRVLEAANKKRKKNGQELLIMSNLADKAINDINLYKFIGQGNTAGVFQLESPGMTDVMKQLFQDVNQLDKNDPNVTKELFERLVAGLSLYRPGPMDEIPNYIKNMLDPDGIVYDSPELERILSATYNVIVYQEQVMFIVRELAGFSRGQSDTIRKAMGKKNAEIINQYEEYFLYGNEEMGIKGCQQLGIDMDLAKDIWERMRKFAEYAFNKSHAVGYANVAISNAYLAYYYPVETLCETLNSYKNADRIKQFIGVSKARGIQVLPPDVNASGTKFIVEGDAIRFGFSGLKNMGKSGMLIIDEREKRGPFKSLFDFVQRMAVYQRIDKRMMEALIYSGSLDTFSGTRKEKLSMMDTLLGIASATKELRKERAISLFNTSAFQPIRDILITSNSLGEIDFQTKLIKEKEYTGFYVTGHPIDQYTSILSRLNIKDLNKINTFIEVEEEEVISNNEMHKKRDIDTSLVGAVQEIETFITRKGDQMASFEIEDETGVIRAVMFPREYVAYSELLKEGHVVAFTGKVTYGERGTQFIVSSALTIEELSASTSPNYIQLTLSDSRDSAKIELDEIEEIFHTAEQSGITNTIPVVFVMNGRKFTKRKGREIFGNISGDTIKGLQTLLGKDNVYVAY